MRWVPRIGQVNAVLVALYFMPLSAVEAIRALMSPVYGLDDSINLAAAAFYRQLFDFGGEGLIRIASLLAGLKLLTAAMFLALAIDVLRGLIVRRDGDHATIDAALSLACLNVILWAVPAYADGNGELIRLYATQFLLIAGAVVVVMVERMTQPAPAPATRAAMWFALSEVEKMRAEAAIAALPPVVMNFPREHAREPAPAT